MVFFNLEFGGFVKIFNEDLFLIRPNQNLIPTKPQIGVWPLSNTNNATIYQDIFFDDVNFIIPGFVFLFNTKNNQERNKWQMLEPELFPRNINLTSINDVTSIGSKIILNYCENVVQGVVSVITSYDLSKQLNVQLENQGMCFNISLTKQHCMDNHIKLVFLHILEPVFH